MIQTGDALFLAKLFGPNLEETIEALKGFAQSVVSIREAFPEVHVRFTEPAVLQELIARFGPAVFTISDLSFEAIVGGALVAKGWTLATAESCTGGLIGHMVTNVPGSSNYYKMGVVAYSNEAKVRILGVPEDLIARYGAVSEPVVRAMAERVRALSGSDVAVSVSGVAGPGGGTPEKPVGTVWMAVAAPSGTFVFLRRLKGERAQIKLLSAYHALDLVRRLAIDEKLVA